LSEDGRSNRLLFLDTLRSLGVPEQTARGALGSIAWESGHNLKNSSTNAGDGADGSDSIGWGQWNSTRATSLKATAAALGVHWSDPRAQAEHIKNELTGPYKGVLDALRSQDDMHHGADVWTRQYEVPAIKNVDQRYGRAVELANLDGVLPSRPAGIAPVSGLGDGVNPQTMDVRPYSDHTGTDMWTPPIDADPIERMKKRDEDAARIASTSFGQTLKDAYSTSSLTGSVLRAGTLSGFEPDSTYRMSKEEFDRRTENLSPFYHDWFDKAVSSEHADAIQRAAEQHQKSEQTLNEQGWWGTAARGIAAIADPTGLAAGIATGGIGNVASAAARVGKAGHVAIQAGLGAASNVAIDKGLEAAGDPERHDLMTSALMGATMGTAYGLLSRAPHADAVVRRATKDLHDALGEPKPPIVDDPHGPTPEHPEPIRPADPTAPRRTGDKTLDESLKRNEDWERIDRADELFRRRLAAREGKPPEPTLPPDSPVPEPPPGTPEPAAPRPLGPNEVETNFVVEHSSVRKAAQYIEGLAAKLGVTALVRVGDIRTATGRASKAFGFAVPLSDGSIRLMVNPTLPADMLAETATHELAHVYDMQHHGLRLYRGQAEAVGGAVRSVPELTAAHRNWVARAAKQTITEFHNEHFAPGQKPFMDLRHPAADTTNFKSVVTPDSWAYRVSHQEWLAQEFTKWAASTKSTQDLAGKFYKAAMDVWRRMYYVGTGKLPENVPTEEFTNWVRGVYNEHAVPAPQTGRLAALASASEGPLPTEVGQPVIFPGRPELAGSNGLGGVAAGDAPKTALGNLRFSIAAKLGSSDNPAVRALGSLLVEDNVGKEGGALNPHSAELYKRQKVNSSITRIAQARKPAWDEWRQHSGLSWLEARNREGEFESTIADAMRLSKSSTEFQAMPDWAKKVSAQYNAIAEEVRSHMENPFLAEGYPDARPVEGFGSTKGDERYLTRVWSASKISKIVTEDSASGYGRVEHLITGAIGDAQPWLPQDVLERLGKGFTREIYKRAHGVIDEDVARMFAVDNLETLKWHLTQNLGVSEDDAEAVVRGLRKGQDSAADPRAKRRVLMNEQFDNGDLKLSDLLVNNATALTGAYARHGWGKVSLARLRVPDGNGGLLVNGITNDGDWNTLMNAIRAKGHDAGISQEVTKHEIEALQVSYDQIKGVGHPLQDTRMAKMLRVAGKLNLMRLGHQFVFAQMGEAYNMLAGLNLEAMAKQVPSFQRIVTADGRWVKANGLDRWVEDAFGLGAEGVRLMADTTHADDLHSLPMEASGFWDHADHTLNSAGNAVLHLSGFHYADGLMKQWTAKTIAQQMFDMSRKFREVSPGKFDLSGIRGARMRQLGLSDDMLNRIIGEMKVHAKSEDGAFFGHKLTDVQPDKWADQEARIAFEASLMRKARQVIQENDIGSMHQWMPHPVWQMITQFRAFPIHAWDKQLMLNVNMHDGESLVAGVLGSVIPTLIYSVQQHIASLGRSDSGEWLDKRLDTQHLISAAIQRHGWSSMLPTAVDSALPFFGQKPFFDSRNTGQQADLIFGNPTASIITDASKAVGGLIKATGDGRRLSQDELRDWHRLFGNNLVTGAVLNSMIGDRPVHPPQTNRH
jgi:hypothetical protein